MSNNRCLKIEPKKTYFGEEQEQAVVRYLSTESEIEKNKIFNEYLKRTSQHNG